MEVARLDYARQSRGAVGLEAAVRERQPGKNGRQAQADGQGHGDPEEGWGR